MLVVAVVLFVVANSFAEEIAYRGLAFDAALTILPPGGAVGAQALAFGAVHVPGFPSGWAGVGLSLVCGVALGILRRVTAGLWLPILAHMGADATIVVLVITLLPST